MQCALCREKSFPFAAKWKYSCFFGVHKLKLLRYSDFTMFGSLFPKDGKKYVVAYLHFSLGWKTWAIDKVGFTQFLKISFSYVSPEEQRKCSLWDKYLFWKSLNERTKTKNTSGNWVLNKKNEDLLTTSLLGNSKFLWPRFAKATHRKSAASPKPCCWDIYSLRWHHSGHN